LKAVKSKFSLDKRRGFAVVMGSSLESLFEATEQDSQSNQLWTMLDVLLDPYNVNPHAIAVLTHTTTFPLQAPVDGSFRLLRQVSGSVFGMQTQTQTQTTRVGNSSSSSSCFEISFFQRSSPSTLKQQHEDL
jgi:hypothetical protein